jgi:hypothetical protein
MYWNNVRAEKTKKAFMAFRKKLNAVHPITTMFSEVRTAFSLFF